MRWIQAVLTMAAVLAAAVGAPRIASAGPALELGLTGGGKFFEGEEDLIYGYDVDLRSPTHTIPAPEYGLRLDVLANQRLFFEVETLYTRAVTLRRTSPVNETQFRVGIGYNLKKYSMFRSWGTLTPNVVGFIGGRDLRNDIYQQTRGAVTWGLGAKYNCGKWVLRADARHSLSTPSLGTVARNNFDFTVGVGYLIGGQFTPCGPSEPIDRSPEPWIEPPMPPQPPPVQPEPLRIPGVRFALESAELTAGQLATLDDAVDILRAHPEVTVEIRGYADSTGPLALNRDLSQRRADAVRAYLVSRGVDPSRLTATGYGISDPIGDNETQPGRAMNRRAVFKIVE